MLSSYSSSTSGIKALTSSVLTSIKTAASTAATNLQDGLEAFDSKYCSAAVFEAPATHPARFTGPSFTLEFATGNCTFNETAFVESGEKRLDCFEPSITYTKTPSNFTSKYISGASFTSKSCLVGKTFGEETTQVLAVFDGTTEVTKDGIAEVVRSEVAKLLSSLAALKGK